MVRIPYGISNFELIRSKKENYLYVDKTHFLHGVENAKYLMHLRPRRFGKSLFLSMMDCYYDVAAADQFDELFGGLHVYEYPTENRNNYYILRLDFSGIENDREDGVETGFLRRVKIDAERFINRYKLDIQLSQLDSPAGILDDLLEGFQALKLPQKIYILIDEYDHFTNSVLGGDGEMFLEVLRRGGFIRSFYEVIKRNTGLGVVERLFITGVMSVTLDSLTSGFNITSNMTTHQDFSDMMGFTADEVKDMLRLSFVDTRRKDKEELKADLGKPADLIQLTDEEQAQIFEIFQQNYNGYLFSPKSDVKIFNSTLIMYYLAHYMRVRESPESLVDLNLNQSGATIESIVELKTPEQNYELIQEIVEYKEVVGELEPFINIDKKVDQNDIITMLYNIGILTIKNDDFGQVFEIPNKTIQRIYLQYLSELLQRRSDYRVDTRKQTLAFREIGKTGRVDALTRIVEDLLMHASNRNLIALDEKHVKFVYFMLTHATEDFIVYDEFPVGNGYADIFIQKTLTTRAKYEVFIELKYLKKKETNEVSIGAKLEEGIAQIEGYLKDKRLVNRVGMKKYVIVFSGYEVVKIHEVVL